MPYCNIMPGTSKTKQKSQLGSSLQMGYVCILRFIFDTARPVEFNKGLNKALCGVFFRLWMNVHGIDQAVRFTEVFSTALGQ